METSQRPNVSPWVLGTIEYGYRITFTLLYLPHFNCVFPTTVKPEFRCLNWSTSLLGKGAIECVPLPARDFTDVNFWCQKHSIFIFWTILCWLKGSWF